MMAAAICTVPSLLLALLPKSDFGFLYFIAWLFLPRISDPPRTLKGSKRLYLSLLIAYFIMLTGLGLWYSFSSAVLARVVFAFAIWLPWMVSFINDGRTL
jgi:hypothetical protein